MSQILIEFLSDKCKKIIRWDVKISYLIPSFLPCVISNNIYNFIAMFTEYYVSNTYNLYFSNTGSSNNL